MVAVIDGVERFTGADLVAPDLRAGAALVLAGLSAEGITTVDDIESSCAATRASRRSCRVLAQ